MALPAIFDPIVAAPRPQKIIFGVFGLVAIGAAAWFLVLSPLSTRVGILTTERDKIQRDLVQARVVAADVARFRREIAALEKTLVALTERLPNERETPPLYRSVSDAAYQVGLAVALFQPRDPVVRDYYAEIPIVFSAQGNYHQFGAFFERVARLPRVVNVGDLRMTSATAPKNPKDTRDTVSTGSVRGDLVLATYMYRPVGSAPAPKPGAKPGAAPRPGGTK
jgi:type IV pilus assembly protein PilO